MNWVSNIVCLFVGLGVGYALTPSGGQPVSSHTKQVDKLAENKVQRGRQKIEGVSNSAVQRAFAEASIPRSYMTGNKSVEEWADILQGKWMTSDGNWHDYQKNADSMKMLVHLIPDNQIVELVALLQKEEPDHRNSMMLNPLYQRWYVMDAAGMTEWTKDDDGNSIQKKVAIMLAAAWKYDRDEATQMYKKLMKEDPNFATARYDTNSMLVMGHLANTASVEDFWDVYDGMPSALQKSIFQMGGRNMAFQQGDHERHLEAFKARNSGRLNRDILSSWAKQDAKSFLTWYESGTEKFKEEQTNLVFTAMAKSTDEKVLDFLANRVASDPEMKTLYMSNIRNSLYSIGIEGYRKKLERVGALKDLNSKDLKPVMRSMVWNKPLEIPKLAALITDPEERFKALSNGLKELSSGQNELNERDLNVISAQLKNGLYTTEQQIDLMKILEKKTKTKTRVDHLFSP